MSTAVTAASPLSRKSETQRPDTQALAKQIRAIETAGRGGYSLGLTGKGTISSGCSVLDNALPGGGYLLGTIVEWVDGGGRGGDRGGGGFGNGSLYLALTAARYAMQESNKYVVVIDSDESFYPPAALYMGLALERIIVLRPPSFDDAMWAIDQSLRSSAVAAVVARLDKLSDLNARRFQLAAEQNGALGLFLRPASARSQPSWSEVQWGICNHRANRLPASQNTEPMALATGSPRIQISNAVSKTISNAGGNPELAFTAQGGARQIHLESLRMRGGRSGQHWMLMIDTQSGTITGRKLVERTVERNNVAASTSSIRLASQLAMPTSPRPANTSQPAKRNRAS
ncbi:MAG: hypothetical protein NTW52_09950 [Planctomycetota bacterium]|nr:hypothetical protein [Planctomycetota bacterium]